MSNKNISKLIACAFPIVMAVAVTGCQENNEDAAKAGAPKVAPTAIEAPKATPRTQAEMAPPPTQKSQMQDMKSQGYPGAK